MGLAEKRAIATVKDNSFITFRKELEGILGSSVEITVNWDQLAVDDYSHLYLEAIPKVYFETLKQSFSSICADSMGKEALQGVLKKIEICNTDSISSETAAFKFSNGVLTFDHSPIHNIDSIEDRAKALTELLEKAL